MTASDDSCIKYLVDTKLYSLEALFRACYVFTDRCYVFLSEAGPDSVCVELRASDGTTTLDDLAGRFANELINQRVRADIALETQSIRELIVARALGEGRFDDPT